MPVTRTNRLQLSLVTNVRDRTAPRAHSFFRLVLLIRRHPRCPNAIWVGLTETIPGFHHRSALAGFEVAGNAQPVERFRCERASVVVRDRVEVSGGLVVAAPGELRAGEAIRGIWAMSAGGRKPGER